LKRTRTFAIGALIALALAVVESRPAQSNDARVEGYVFDADTGLPLANATVRLAGGPTPRATAADDSGRFELAVLAPGRYLLTAVMAGYAIGTFGQRSPADAPRSIELKAGVTRTQADIRLTPLGSVSGRIADEDGRPLPGVQVQAVRRPLAGGDLLGARVAGRGPTGTTDSNGEYRIRDLTAGSYDVIAVPPRLKMGLPGARPSSDEAARQPVPTFYPGVMVAGEAHIVRVELGTETIASFGLRRSRLANISGTVLDSRGRPAADVIVQLDHDSVQLPIAAAATSFSEVTADGQFVLRDVPPGEYHLDARSKSVWEALAQTGSGDTIRTNAPEFASASVRVSGEDIQDLMLRAGSGFVLTGSLTGKLPPSSVRALQISTTAPRNASDATAFLHSARANPQADGSFRLEKVSGLQMIRVAGLPAGYSLGRVNVDGVDVTDEGFEVTRDLSDVEVIIGRDTQIIGRVTESSGVAISGATVIVFSEDRRRRTAPSTRFVASTLAGADGTFLIAGLPPARYYGIALPAVVEGKRVEPDDLQPLESKATRFSLTAGEQRAITLRVE
jgi:protocatechuate 3,4-dioxygenase beta subunit